MGWLSRSGLRWKDVFVVASLVVVSACGQSTGGGGVAEGAVSGAQVNATLWSPWVGVSGFGASELVTVSYDEQNDGIAEWSQTATTSPEGNAPFNLGSLQVKAGSRLTATSASYTRELIVKEVRIEYANSTTNVVAGYAPPASQVRVEVMQPGPPLAQVWLTADENGRWSQDFTALYDIEDGRQLAAEVLDEQGNTSRVTWEAVVPVVGAGYAQYGANSVHVRDFAPGTSVRLRIDYKSDGGPLDGFDFDSTAIVNNRFGFGFDLGGFDLLRPGDRLLATGGGWEKELVTSLLRIEKADPASDVVGGVAVPGATVLAGILPEGGGGPAAAQLSVTANSTDGVWAADFSGIIDFAANRQVTASVVDDDGDQTSTSWYAVTPYFSALVTDGPPSGVSVWGFAARTSIRVRVDLANDGNYEYDLTDEVAQPFGFRFDLGGSGLLNPGDRIVVDGGGWTKEGILGQLSVSNVSFESDRVTGTAGPGVDVTVSVSVPPGDPGGPPIATKNVTADSLGNWVADFSGTVDIVINQQANATIVDSDGDQTEAVGWARTDVWPKSGFDKPIVNPPDYSTRKAGSAVPVSFSLGGDRGMDIFVDGFPASVEIDCDSNPEMTEGEPITFAGRSLLKYNPRTEKYEFGWATKKSWKGTCRQLVVRFVDGSTLRANFRFS